MNCPFCDYNNEIKNRVLKETDHFYLFPALGAFIPGYLMIATKEHHLNISTLPPEWSVELTDLEKTAVSFLKETYHSPIFEYEHGPCGTDNDRGGGCINHCHLGLVATDLDLLDKITIQLGAPKETNSFKGLMELSLQDSSYLLYKKDNKLYYWERPLILSQYIRRLLTEESREDFNWRTNPYPDNIAKNIARWQAWTKK